MSIASMTRLAASLPPAAAPLEAGVKPAQTGAEAKATALEKITAFIPSEVIGIYVAGLGIFSSKEGIAEGVKMAIFWIALALVPVFVWINVRIQNKPPAQPPNWGKCVLLVLFAAVAFVAWAAAIPESPFDLEGYSGQVGAFGVVVLGLVMPGLAQVLGVTRES